MSTLFQEGVDGVLRLVHPDKEIYLQIVVTKLLIPRVLRLAQYARMEGNTGQKRIYDRLQESYYWKAMATEVSTTVPNFGKCARNCVHIKSKTSTIKLFPATRPSEFVALYILVRLTKTTPGFQYELVVVNIFTK